MNNQTVTYTDTHLGWKQRIKRELGSTKLYASKGYKNVPNDMENTLSNFDRGSRLSQS